MVEIRAYRPSDLQAAFALATEVFVAGSTLHRALAVQLEDYRTYLWPAFTRMVDEGLSVVAVDGEGTLLGCMIVVDFHGPVHERPNAHPVFGPVSALTSALCAQYRGYRDISAGEAILVDMGAVAPSAGGQGIYQEMRQEVHRIAKARGFRHVVGELSSVATQHVIFNRLQHRKVAEIRFGAFEHDGGYPFGAIHDPPSIILAEGEL